MNPKTYHVIGLMSGTSGDGTDLAFCKLEFDGHAWRHKILESKTVPYDADMQTLLDGLPSTGGASLIEAHTRLGRYFGRITAAFIREKDIRPDLIASHGHTVFHKPGDGITFQAGSGAHIAAETGIETVADFRVLDVALGGQGAPLVPVGDDLLFGAYDACLNLGGIANVSYEAGGKRIAYDLCPCNMALNDLAGRLGMPFDAEGRVAAGAAPDPELLDRLETLPYYKQPPPKSLGREDYESVFRPELEKAGADTPVLLRTFTEHIARRIAALPVPKGRSMLVTGGGAFNRFLVDRIEDLAVCRLIIPDDTLVNYKESLVFGLLGVLRKRNEINTLKSVTGASRNSSGGTVFLPGQLPADF